MGLRGEDYATKGDFSALEARLEAKIKSLGATVGAGMDTFASQIETRLERAKNVILRSILTGSVAIIVTLIGGIVAILSAG